MTQTTISAQAFKEQLTDTPKLLCIDVRTPAEFRASKLGCSRNLPLQTCTLSQFEKLELSEQQPVYLLCSTGKRAQQAQQQLTACGQTIICVEGGLNACRAAEIPLEEQAGVISLERQVRIVAGSFVVIGTVIGTFVHPTGYGLSAFVGAGLIFAGITDTCGMAMLLAKMPWNR